MMWRKRTLATTLRRRLSSRRLYHTKMPKPSKSSGEVMSPMRSWGWARARCEGVRCGLFEGRSEQRIGGGDLSRTLRTVRTMMPAAKSAAIVSLSMPRSGGTIDMARDGGTNRK